MKIIGGTFGGRVLKSPKGAQTRPTMSVVRKALFDILQRDIEGATFLDAFAGSGLMGIEALSRGASHAIFIDSSKNAIQTLQANLDHLQLKSRSTVYHADIRKAVALIEKTHVHPDIIYLDPPYHEQNLYVDLLEYFSFSIFFKKGMTVWVESPLPGVLNRPFLHLKQISSRRYGSTILYQLIKTE